MSTIGDGFWRTCAPSVGHARKTQRPTRTGRRLRNLLSTGLSIPIDSSFLAPPLAPIVVGRQLHECIVRVSKIDLYATLKGRFKPVTAKGVRRTIKIKIVYADATMVSVARWLNLIQPEKAAPKTKVDAVRLAAHLLDTEKLLVKRLRTRNVGHRKGSVVERYASKR